METPRALVQYDCAVAGGGLAGLCLSIQLARLGHRVVVFEKNRYPFHKVCGEYVSNESFGFLLRLGLPLDEWDLPQISRLAISSEKGYQLEAPLDLGGFGISRYKLDHELVKLAKENGVNIVEQARVTQVENGTVRTNRGDFESRICVGAFGKVNPAFAKDEKLPPAPKYVGVKYHVRLNRRAGRIELHNFRQGYCGVSKVENEKWCVCYLSRNDNLKSSGNSIAAMEKRVLRRNPHLDRLFGDAEFLFDEPLTVSNVRFDARRTSDDKMLYVGDAAGCISPLTGNGMSMSGYASFILSGLIHQHLLGALSREGLHTAYARTWNDAFRKRIDRGRKLQYLFGRRHLSDLALRVLNPLNSVKRRIITSTHGIPF